jgi:hypothetical protein
VSAPVLHGALDDVRDVGNAAAPDADGHASAGRKPRRESAAPELAAGLGTDIGQTAVREILTDDEQAGR